MERENMNFDLPSMQNYSPEDILSSEELLSKEIEYYLEHNLTDALTTLYDEENYVYPAVLKVKEKYKDKILRKKK